MKINFQITDVPTSQQLTYIIAYLEGRISIYIDNKIFFDQQGILLIELAKVIDNWLKSIDAGLKIDFVYTTMDNEEPILLIRHIAEKFYKIDSIWKEDDITQPLTEDEITTEFRTYLQNLQSELKLKCNVDLKKILNS